MARFISAISSTDKFSFEINVDQVLYAQQSNKDPNVCTLIFSGDRAIVIGMSAAAFNHLANGA